MFCTIELIPIQGRDPSEVTEEVLWKFLISLARNGQIFKNYTLVKGINYIFYVTIPKEDSLDEAHDNEYVRLYREQICECYHLTITMLGQNLASQPYCQCSARSAMEMQTYDLDIDSPFTCCDCGKPIALYELPFTHHQPDHYFTLEWQENYIAMDQLWMNSLYEDELTGGELARYDSALNQQGIELARELSNKLHYPVYYHLFNDFSDAIRFEQVDGRNLRICPQCGERMEALKVADEYEIAICKTCQLSADLD